jgi:hypothetical protein
MKKVTNLPAARGVRRSLVGTMDMGNGAVGLRNPEASKLEQNEKQNKTEWRGNGREASR